MESWGKRAAGVPEFLGTRRAERREKRDTLLLSGAAERPEETETTGSDTGCTPPASL